MGAILVMYHYVRDPDGDSGITTCPVADFEGQVEHLLRHYEPLEPAALLAAARSGAAIPDGFVLTFDDGTRDHWDNALPVLERHGLHGIFAPIGLPYLQGRIPFVQKNQFVRGLLGEDGLPDAYLAAAAELAPDVDVAAIMAAAPIGDYRRGTEKYLRFKYSSNRLIPRELSERIMDRLFAEHVSSDELGFIRELYLSTDEIVDLRGRGHTIAGHSIGHPSLPQLEEGEQEREIAESVHWLAGLLGERIDWFNYPYGDHDERSERLCERLGLQVAYSTRPPADWTSSAGRYRVPRVDTCFLPVTGDAAPAVLAGEII
ncbi:MAG: polysaccharide deacetylase family protein [Verrucomicrobiota bacterium]